MNMRPLILFLLFSIRCLSEDMYYRKYKNLERKPGSDSNYYKFRSLGKKEINNPNFISPVNLRYKYFADGHDRYLIITVNKKGDNTKGMYNEISKEYIYKLDRKQRLYVDITLDY